jgi:predicted Zn-dependent protease
VARREDQAIAFANAGRVDLAERLLREQLQETPESSEAHRVLAHCLRVRNKPDAALAEADLALRLSPNSAFCNLERGRALHALIRLGESEHELREAVSLAPASPIAYASLARVLIDRGAVDQAMATARAGLRFDPGNHDCLCALGLALLRAHRVDEAHQVYADALADEPTRAHLHNDLGIVLLHPATPNRPRLSSEKLSA